MKKGLRKFFAIMLSVAMICTYSVTAFAAEGGDGETVTLVTEKSGKVMMTLQENATLADNGDGTYDLTFYMDTTAYDKVYPDAAKKAVFAETYGYKMVEGIREYTIPLEESQLDKEIVVSLHSSNKLAWYDRVFNVDRANNKLIYSDAGHPAISDEYKDIPNDNGLASDLSMFKIRESRSEVNSDGTVTVSFTAGSGSSVQFTKIALVEQDASEEELEAVKYEGSKVIGSENDYEYEIKVPVEKIGEKIPLTTYYISSSFDGWKKWTSQKYLTINPTPSMSDQFISQIYIQQRNEYTDRMCEASKKVWDALAPEQKAEVEEGDYYDRETGDASLDDPLNQDNIGDRELLVVSFGTSFNDSRAKTIGGVEKALAKAFPKYSVRRAFTAQIIINHIQSRDGVKIDNMNQAMDRAVANGVKELVIQPTHLMHGKEYDELMEVVGQYKDKITKIVVAEPLLNSNEDKQAVAETILDAAVKDANCASVEEAANAGTAFVLMGHGTTHEADSDYADMQKVYDDKGLTNVFVGTVDAGEKDEYDPKALEVVKKAVKDAGFTKVILRPLMVVAGDHAENDMADEENEESWAASFKADGFTVESQLAGLGQIEAIQNIYVAHCEDVMESVHDYVLKNAKKATCTAAGYTGDQVCSVCGDVKEKGTSIPKSEHKYELKNKKSATCTTAGYTGDQVCSVCEEVIKGTTIKALGHKYVVTKAFKAATTSADGNKEQKTCSRNKNHVTGGEVIKRISSVTLSKTAYTYDGNTHKPVVTVKDRSGNKISTANYTVTYKNYKSVGKATVTVTFKNNYKGTVTKSFKINPKGTSLASVKKGSKSFTAKWYKQSTKMSVSRITGYQVKYATNSSMTSAKTVTIKGYSATSKKISSLKANKKYYVKVRTYKVVNGAKYYSVWSSAKTVTTK